MLLCACVWRVLESVEKEKENKDNGECAGAKKNTTYSFRFGINTYREEAQQTKPKEKGVPQCEFSSAKCHVNILEYDSSVVGAKSENKIKKIAGVSVQTEKS